MTTINQPAPRDVREPLTPADLATVGGGSPVLMLKCATGKPIASPRGATPLASADLRHAAGGLLLPAVQKVRGKA